MIAKNTHISKQVKIAAWTIGIIVLLTSMPAHSQDGCQPPYPGFEWEDHFTALTRLGTHWMPAFGDGDSMSRPFWLDQGVSYPYGSAGFQETWYIARDQLPGTAPFYSLYNASEGNHKDAPTATEGSYITDLGQPHGYAWLVGGEGMRPLSRYYRSVINDHRTWLFSEAPTGYATNAIYWGYADPTLGRWGYERFGNSLDKSSVVSVADSIGQKMQNSKLRLGFNPIWGNAIGEITHLQSGRQIVSHAIGDMVQSVIFYGGPDPNHVVNPTQSGGADCSDYGDTNRWAGSPVLSSSVSGTSPQTFVTLVRPLDFCHACFEGTDPWSPRAWRGLFQVSTTLGCKVRTGQVSSSDRSDTEGIAPRIVTREDVIKISFQARKDGDAPFSSNPQLMRNTGWLLGEHFGDCRSTEGVQVEVVNLTTGLVETVYNLMCGTEVELHGETDMGFRLASPAGDFSVGFTSLGTVDHFRVWSRCAWNCEPAQQRIILSSSGWHNVSSTDWETDDVFWVVGTPAQVVQRLREIRNDGGNCLE